MITPSFVWDEDANGWLSDDMLLSGPAVVTIMLSRFAPVVTQKQADDGEWETFACTPDESDTYRITLNPTHEMIVRLASPVAVKACEVFV